VGALGTGMPGAPVALIAAGTVLASRAASSVFVVVFPPFFVIKRKVRK